MKPRTSGKSLAEDLASEEGWLSATVPSIVHDVLWQAGQIPNPYQSPSLPKLLPTFLNGTHLSAALLHSG
ncbi:MAG: hypothetical protein U0787_18760 [Polyangia bacterium]